MWNSGVSAPSAGSVTFMPTVGPRESAPVRADGDVPAVKTLLSQLFEAVQASKTQTAQDLRDKLNDLRQKMGDEKFKEALNSLIKDANSKFLEFLRQLLEEWFPDEGAKPSTPPAPKGGGGGGSGGGGGGGGRVGPEGFGPSKTMGSQDLTEGAKYFNYTPEKEPAGVKPRKDAKDGNIWSGFSQGPDGNCVSVSAIKAAMMQFGQKPTDVFTSVEKTSTGYKVEMRDGKKVEFTNDELKMAAEQARFKGNDPTLLTSANFMFCAICKRAQNERNDGIDGSSFMDAIRSVNDGEQSREGLDRLGLKNNYRPATDADLRSSRVGTVEYNGHSMAVIDGNIELWGNKGGVPASGIATVLFG